MASSGKNRAGFLQPHAPAIVQWLAEDVSQADILRRLASEHGVDCSKATLSEFIKTSDLKRQAEELRSLLKRNAPGPTPPPTPTHRATPAPASPNGPAEPSVPDVIEPHTIAPTTAPTPAPAPADPPGLHVDLKNNHAFTEGRKGFGGGRNVASSQESKPAAEPPPPHAVSPPNDPAPGATGGPRPAPAAPPPIPYAPLPPEPEEEPDNTLYHRLPRWWQEVCTREQSPAPDPLWDFELPILEFGGGDVWDLRAACEGTFILGATGSGKTSGSGRTLAHAFLGSGFGGLVLTAKEDERDLWVRYARETGRSEHLCVVEPGGPFRFNFLDYEARRQGPGDPVGVIENVVSLFHTLAEVQARKHHDGKGGGGSFWVNAGKQLLRNALRIIVFHRDKLRLREILAVIHEAPQTLAAAENQSWRKTPHFGPFLEESLRVCRGTDNHQAIEAAQRYWLGEFAGMAEKTRSIIVTSLTAMIDAFFDPGVYPLFCKETTLIPEAAHAGGIILVHLPLKRYPSVGLTAQSIWKYLFQQAVERRASEIADERQRHRDPRWEQRARPVFLWADEAQFFYSEYDSHFQSTARSSRCATVYLTQNISNFYGLFGGDKNLINGFLGNLTTKVVHANNDPESNRWAAEQIGKGSTYLGSSSTRSAAAGQGGDYGMREQIDFEVQPAEFLRLRTGGHANGGLIDAYFIKSGARFRATGKHYFKVTFQQELR